MPENDQTELEQLRRTVTEQRLEIERLRDLLEKVSNEVRELRISRVADWKFIDRLQGRD